MSLVSQIVKILKNGPRFVEKILLFHDHLDLTGNKRTKIDLAIKNGSIDYSESLKELLEDWMLQKGKNATIKNLVKLLEDMECTYVAEVISDTFPLDSLLDGRTPKAVNNSDNQGSGSQIPPVAASPPVPKAEKSQADGKDVHDFCLDMEPLKIQVVKGKEFLGETGNHYSLRSSPRGHALIINNLEFKDPKMNRKGGGERDEEYMDQLFTQLGFKTEIVRDIENKDELEDSLKAFKRKFQKGVKVDCCVVVVMSHGEHGQVILCNETKAHVWNDIVYQFDHIKAPELKGIPKIFIMQACQNFRTSSDAGCGSPQMEDTIVCFPTLPGSPARRDLFKGSWFLYILSKVMMEEAHSTHFFKMLTKVYTEMKKVYNEDDITQLPTYQINGFNHELYFNPGVTQ